MPINDSSPEDIREAIRRFDGELRDTPDWQNWEDNQKHKYAIFEDGRRYPMKKIISMASETPTDKFTGGPESIQYAEQKGFTVVALNLPTKTRVIAALHDLLLENQPQPVVPSDAYEVLADRFKLSVMHRSMTMENSDEVHWENRVRQARRTLVDEGVIDNSERGSWNLSHRETRKYWVEKCSVTGRPDREDGPHALGQALWSPLRDRADNDIYRCIRLVEPGDVVFHLIDNEKISGLSIVAKLADPTFTGLPGTDWTDLPGYRVLLRDYVELAPSIDQGLFLNDAGRQVALQEILDSGAKVFFNSNFKLNEGAYFTEAPEKLVDIINDVYRSKSGRSLPHVDEGPPAQLVQLNEKRVRGSILLFHWTYGEGGFASDQYLREERDYKLDLVRNWQSTVTADALGQALEGGEPTSFANEIGQLLASTNLLPWRYADAVRNFETDETARTFLTAIKDLLFQSSSENPDIDGFNEALGPRYQEALNEQAIKPASHCIPSLVLWLSYPDSQFLVRPEIYNRACRVLTGSVAEGQGNIMSTAYYVAAVAFARALRVLIADLGPRDMIDVQGFCWCVYSQRQIWFGGKTYDGHTDMLPEFITRQLYAIGFGRRDEIAQIFSGVPALGKESRETRRTELEKLCRESKDSERKALLGFFDLLTGVGSTLLAKSSWYDRGHQRSLLRIYAVGITGDHVDFDEDIGHSVAVDWRSQPSHTVDAQEYFGDLANTLTVHRLERALDIISGDPPSAEAAEPTQTSESEEADEIQDEGPAELPVQPAYTIDDFVADTGLPADLIDSWRRRLRRKMQMVFQGPPGTGKTFVAERLARLIVSGTTGRWDVVQFHPSYSYEDFMQGIRPQVISGGLTYQIEQGRFLDFCRKAEMRVDRSPCVLIIDELNRAKLPRVFGELMYLLEYRDKKISLSIGGQEFQIPQNVYLIGTMNTADRSIALVDHALRRRFSFVHLDPDYDVLRQRLERDGLPSDSLVTVLQTINRQIDDRNYEIGISFFMKDGPELRQVLPEVWKGEIEPYLEEYFYDQIKKVEAFRWEVLITNELSDWA